MLQYQLGGPDRDVTSAVYTSHAMPGKEAPTSSNEPQSKSSRSLLTCRVDRIRKTERPRVKPVNNLIPDAVFHHSPVDFQFQILKTSGQASVPSLPKQA